MADWVSEHRDSILFVVLLGLGAILVLGGAYIDRPSVMAFGASLFGIPEVRRLAKGGGE